MQKSSLEDIPGIIRTAMEDYFAKPDPEQFSTGRLMNVELGDALDAACSAVVATEQLIEQRDAAHKLAIKKKRHPSIIDEACRQVRLAQSELRRNKAVAAHLEIGDPVEPGLIMPLDDMLAQLAMRIFASRSRESMRVHIEGHLKCCLENSPQFYDRPICKDARAIAAALKFAQERQAQATQNSAQDVTKDAVHGGHSGDTDCQVAERRDCAYVADEGQFLDKMFMTLMDAGIVNMGSFYEDYLSHAKAMREAEDILMRGVQNTVSNLRAASPSGELTNALKAHDRCIKTMKRWSSDIPRSDPTLWPEAAIYSVLAEFEVRPMPRPTRQVLLSVVRELISFKLRIEELLNSLKNDENEDYHDCQLPVPRGNDRVAVLVDYGAPRVLANGGINKRAPLPLIPEGLDPEGLPEWPANTLAENKLTKKLLAEKIPATIAALDHGESNLTPGLDNMFGRTQLHRLFLLIAGEMLASDRCVKAPYLLVHDHLWRQQILLRVLSKRTLQKTSHAPNWSTRHPKNIKQLGNLVLVLRYTHRCRSQLCSARQKNILSEVRGKLMRRLEMPLEEIEVLAHVLNAARKRLNKQWVHDQEVGRMTSEWRVSALVPLVGVRTALCLHCAAIAKFYCVGCVRGAWTLQQLEKRGATYCSEDCQRQHRTVHQSDCATPGDNIVVAQHTVQLPKLDLHEHRIQGDMAGERHLLTQRTQVIDPNMPIPECEEPATSSIPELEGATAERDTTSRIGLSLDESQEAKSRGETVLLANCRLGHIETVNALLRTDCDATAVDRHGHTALMLAAGHGHRALIRRLADLETPLGRPAIDLEARDDSDGCSAFLLCCREGLVDSVAALVDVGCDEQATDFVGNNGLMIAAVRVTTTTHSCCPFFFV
eukprot:SAG31_NODE_1334_length_8741_cov_4.311618_3_plen_883_part_00